MTSIANTIADRRTIPLFDADRPVPQALLEQAIEAASWAPNHHLTEPWHFYQLGEETTAAYLDLLFDVIKELKSEKLAIQKKEKGLSVPGWLIVTCESSADSNLCLLEDYAAVSCAIQNLSLVLWEAGVGMKWSSGPVIRDHRLYQLLGIDREQQEIVAVIPYGYPKVIPEPRPRKSVNQILDKLT